MTTIASNASSRAHPVPLDEDGHFPPAPPPKITQDEYADDSQHRNPPSILNTAVVSPSSSGLQLPRTPTSPSASSAPPSPPAPGEKPKKSNPLTDLIDTEKSYVDHLAGVIRKVAAAWSRSNLPPPELDTMFRTIEGIYKANRALLGKLKEIGTSPSSPKALGDLLMRWIDDLEAPYTLYASKFITGFDVWDPVVNNSRLPTTLALFSSSNPPTVLASSHPSEPPLWTLDALFLLPHGRLKYYRKLYSRLLKSTAPGRSDYKLLVGALEKLDRLLETVEGRSAIKVASQAALSRPPVEDEVVNVRTQRELPPPIADPKESSSSDGGSGSRHESFESGGAPSQETAATSVDRGSTSTLSAPLSDLERRLSTAKTLDLFTMKPRDVKLQILPPGLTYTRELRISVDVIINFTPKSTGEDIVFQRGHIFLLTDLFLVCERMLPSERVQHGPDGPEMNLMFPPLAGKHLRVSEVPDSDTALILVILRKETLFINTPTPALRRKLLDEFRDCIDTAASIQSRAKQEPPPPVPLLPRSTSSPFPATSPQPSDFRGSESSNNMSPPTRAFSPGSEARPENHRFSPPSRTDSGASNRRWSPSARPGENKLVLSPDAQVQQVNQRVPSLKDPLPGPMYPPRTSSTAETILDPSMERRGSGGHPPGAFPPRSQFPPGAGPPSFAPGQIMASQSYTPGSVYPPSRSTSVGHQSPPNGPPPRGPGGQFSPPPGQYPGPPGSYPLGPHGQHPPGPPGQYLPGPPGHYPPGQHPPPGQYRQPPPGQYPGPQPPPGPGGPPRQPPYGVPARPPSEPSSALQPNVHHGLRKSQSSYSMASQYDDQPLPPVPSIIPRNNSFGSLHAPQARPLLPSAQMSVRSMSMDDEISPPGSPVQEEHLGPTTSTISAQMKCKVFLKQQHAQWKSLGTAKLKLYREDPTNVKQLVVEADNKAKSIVISTIVLTDGVERVGKTGVAVELSNKGARTGVVYMIQLRNEAAAQGLFDSLLAGSDRS